MIKLSNMQIINYIKNKLTKNNTRKEDMPKLQECLQTMSTQRNLTDEQYQFIMKLRNEDMKQQKNMLKQFKR